MTNREYMIKLLQSPGDDSIRYFNQLFVCRHVTNEECMKHDNCCDCWQHWLESEVETDDQS